MSICSSESSGIIMPDGRYCRALGCGSNYRYDKSLSFFRFPKDDRSQIWVERAANPKLFGLAPEILWKRARLCNLHFADSAFTNVLRKRLVFNALPSLNLAAPVEPFVGVEEPPEEVLQEEQRMYFFEDPEMEVIVNEDGASYCEPCSPPCPLDSNLEEMTPTKYQRTLHSSTMDEREVEDSAFKTPSPRRAGLAPIARRKLKRAILQSVGATRIDQLTPRKAKLFEMLRRARKQLNYLKRKCQKSKSCKQLLTSTLKSSVISEIEENVSPAAARLFASQLKCGNKAPRGRRYTMDEKIFALSVYKRGPKAYKLLQTMFALPSPRTLISLLNRVPFLPGINKGQFAHLKEKVSKMEIPDRACALLFDEVSLSISLQYLESLDCIVGFEDFGDLCRTDMTANHALVFMVRGLRKSWKQPIAYFFCKDVTKTNRLQTLIVQVIEALQDVGLHILCTICDQGATNRAALQNLVVTRPSSVNLGKHGMIFKVNDDDIAVIYDPPHLLKSTRNAFMNYNVVWTPTEERVLGDPQTNVTSPPERAEASWDHVKLFAQKDKEALFQRARRLSQAHIEPNSHQKMRVNLAAQVLSQSVALGISTMIPDPTLFRLAEPPESNKHYMPMSARWTALFILYMDQLFDSFNGVKIKSVDKKYHRVALTCKSIHVTFWPAMSKLIDSWEFTNKTTRRVQRSPFQDGWLTTIAGATYVGTILREKYSVIVLRMNTLNQDAIENLFCVIRQNGQDNTNPSCYQFISALKTCIVNNLMRVRAKGSNCLADSDVLLTDLKSFLLPDVSDQVAAEEAPLEHEEHDDLNNDIEDENSEFNLDDCDFTEDVFVEILEEMRQDAVQELPEIERPTVAYVCGYIVRKVADLSCERCKSLLIVETSEHTSDHTFTESRERSDHSSLIYVSAQLITSMGLAAQVINKHLKRAPHILRLKAKIEHQIFSQVDFRWFNCEIHRESILQRMITLLCRVTIHHFCKKLNRSMKGRESAGGKPTARQKRIRKVLHK